MKRTISFLLSLAMIITMLPAGAFAAELETTPVVETQAVTEAPTEQETEAAETTAAETEPTENTEAVIPEEPAAETEEAPTEAAAAETVAEEAAATVEDDFRAALENAAANGTGLTVWDEITLTRDLTVNLPGELSFADFSRLVVPSGVTLTLNCPTVINGATLVVEEGGKLISNASLSVVAPLNPATFDMNGEFTNNGKVWVNEGATVNINGTATSWYREFHVGFGGNGKTSTLNINGTMTTYGYLNIADAGAPGVLNVAGKLILEKDGNGNAYLQAGNPVNVTGTLESRAAVTIGNDAGTAVLTVAEGGSLTVSDSAMWFDIAGGGALVNNGTLTNNFYHIGNYGAFSNNGTLNNNAKIRNYGTYTNNGTVSGNAPVDGVADARNMFLEGITNAAANGENYTVWDEVILTENLTVNMTGELSFADFSRLVVPSGVTLTLNCPTVINGAALIVEEGGKLISNASLSVAAPLNPATFDMSGEFTNNGQVWVNEGATANLGGTANSTGDIFVGFGGNGRTSTLNLSGTLSTSGYLCISNSGAPGLLKVNQGAILNIQNVENVGRGYLDNTSRVEINGTLNVDGLFTTGAAKDDDGNVVGPDASAEIRGQVMGSGTSTIVAGTHGAVNVFGNLNTSGEVVVEQESALWVDSTVTMNGPVTVAGALHVDFIDDVAGTGYLMLGGTTNVTGYLAVHDGGTLNTGAASVLNIQNIENVGRGYLDNQGTVTLNGNMYLDGLFTTGAVQDDSGNVVGTDATATNNGAIEASETSLLGVGAGGTMYNNGTVNTKGELTVDGVWKGTPAVTAPAQEVGTMTQDEFIAAIAAADGDYHLEDSVYIYSDMAISGFVIVEEAGELYICDGVTLALDGIVQVNGGKMEIRDGGAVVANVQNSGVGVINDGTLTIKNGGTLDVSAGTMGVEGGHVIAEAGASVIGDTIEFNPLEGSVTGIPASQMTAVGGAGDQVLLEQILNAVANYQRARVYVFEPFALSRAVTVPAGTVMEVGAQNLEVVSGGKITVCGEVVVSGNIYITEGGAVSAADGGKITVKTLMQAGGGDVTVENGGSIEVALNEDYSGGVGVFDGGSLTVKAGGSLNTGNGEVGVDGGTLIAENGAIILGDGFGVNYVESTVVGISPDRISLNGPVFQQSELEEILSIAENYKGVGVFVEYDAQLSGEVTIPANTSIYFTSGAYTIASGAVVTVDGTMVVFEEAAVTNNGTVWLASEESLELMGTWNGNPAQVGQQEKTMSFEEFKAALAAGGLDLKAKVTVEENLTVDTWLYIYEGGELIVPNGVTLTVNSAISVMGGKIAVEEGGSLVNHSHLYVENDGILEVAGTYTAEEYNYLFLQYGEGTVTGVDKNMITLRDMADSEESLRALAAMTGYRSVDIDMMDPVRLSADLTIGKGVELCLYAGMVLTVPSGVTLRIDGNLGVFDAGVVVEPGGMLVVSQQGYMQVSGAYLHAEGATLDIHPRRLHVNLGGDLELTGVDLSVVGATVSVGTYDELVAAVAYCGQYGFVEIEPYATITVEEDLTIPENSMYAMYDHGELMQLIIPDGVTVTNCTTIVVNSNCQVWIQAGGTLDNSQGGSVNDYTGTGLIVDGTLIGDTTGGGGGGGNYGGVTSFDELKAAIEAGSGDIDINGSITVTENLMVPENCYVFINYDGELIIPSGVSFTTYSGMSIFGGKLTVEDGGAFTVAAMYVNGTFTVHPGATFTLLETGNMTVRYGDEAVVIGVPQNSYTLEYYAENEADIRSGLALTGYGWVAVHLFADVTLASNLTIPESTSLIIDTRWNENGSDGGTLTIPKGRTITNNGFLVTTEPDGCLVIEQGGKIINNGTFNNRGILVNDGEIVNNETAYIYGEMSGSGTITGEGHLDYARPVNSYADLVNWLGTNPVPTYLYVWGEVTLEDDVTIPEGTQLIMEGSTLIVPDGVTLTVKGELLVQYGGVATFEKGSKLINVYEVMAFHGGTINIYGTYVRENPDANLALYAEGIINGVANSSIHYADSFADEASLQAILNKVKTEGYGQVTVYIQYGCGQVEITGDVTIPEGGYLLIGSDSLMLKPGATLTNNGEIHVYSPAQLIVDSGAELIDNGKIYADEGCLVYLGGGIDISADAQQILGKGKANITAALTPASSAKITWTLAEGDELYATLKGSGSKAVLTAADVTGKKTVKVIASAKLANGAEVSDAIEITIIPLTKQITLLSEGEDVTGQIITCDLAGADASLALTLTADIGPDDAAPALEWTSSDETIATVENGRVTLSGRLGTATVTAAATDGSKVSAKVTIVATELVQSVALREGATELVGGKGTQLKVCDALDPGKALPADAVTWTLANAADAAYVAVTPAGKVTTKAVPEKITVKLLGTVTANPKAEALEHTITIYPAVTQVDLIDGDEIYTGRTVKLSGGTSIILQAKQYPVDSMAGVTWEISDKDEKFVEVLSAEDEALVLKSTGVKGTVTVKITAADGSKKSASVKIQTGIFLEEITVTSPSIELRSGESVQLSAEVKPTNANNMSVAWALADANDKQFVSVSSSGKVTAKKGLSMSKPITVVATAKDGGGAFGSFTLQLQPADPGALVILAEDNANVTGTTVNVDLLTGGSIRLKAKYFNTDAADVTWSGKNVTFSAADAAGYVTATVSGKGTFTVTADDGSGKKATVKLKAANLSEEIRISGPDAVSSGKSVQLKATILPEGNVADKKVTWWIDPAHTQYATVSSSGKLTAAKNLTEARNISVWAQAKDGNSEPEMFCVEILPMAQSVQILESGIDVTNTTYIWDLAVDEGNPAITAEVFSADAGQAVVWKLSGAKVLQQNADGTFSVTGKAGTATVTATAADGSGKKASFKFTVVKSMEYIQQAQTEAVIAGGKSLKLASFVIVDKTATNQKLVWSMSGDTEVATLAATGVLKTKKVTDVHTITVTATAADGSGCKAEFTILVYPATTSVKLLCDGSAAPKQATLGIGGTMTLEGISLPSAAAQGPGAYTWKISSDKFAEIQENPDGTVTITGKAAGTVTVTCTAADGTGKKATLKIKIG